jgi:hypothetical protein
MDLLQDLPQSSFRGVSRRLTTHLEWERPERSSLVSLIRAQRTERGGETVLRVRWAIKKT